MALLESFGGVLLAFALLFAGSTGLAALTLRREVREARRKGRPLPVLAAWWPKVLRHRNALVGGGLVALGLGLALRAKGIEAAGRAALLVGAGLFGYLLHAWVLHRVVEKAKRAAPPDSTI